MMIEKGWLLSALPTRLIGSISYPSESDLMVRPTNVRASFSQECILLHLYLYNMHQDTKSATIWNNLPADIRNMDNLSNFKSKLKTHLFIMAFS